MSTVTHKQVNDFICLTLQSKGLEATQYNKHKELKECIALWEKVVLLSDKANLSIFKQVFNESQVKKIDEVKAKYAKKEDQYQTRIKEFKKAEPVVKKAKPKDDFDSWLDDERNSGSDCSEGVYLGDGVYM